MGQQSNSENKRTFYRLSKSWFFSASVKSQDKDFVEEFTIQCRGPEVSGDFVVRYKRMDGRIVPKLEVFDDAWKTLALFPDLLAKMAGVDNQKISPDEFADILTGLGIAEITEQSPSYIPNFNKEPV